MTYRATTPAVASVTAPSLPPSAISDNGNKGDLREGASTPPASLVVADGKGGGFDIAGMVSGWGMRGTETPRATRERSSGKNQPPKQKRQQWENGRPQNQQQQQPATETISTATSSSTPITGGGGKFSERASVELDNDTAVPGASNTAAAASVPAAAMSEIEKRARQYMQEKAEATTGPKAGRVEDKTKDVIEGTTNRSPLKGSSMSSSRTQTSLESRRRSAKMDNERSATLPNKNAAKGGAKDSGNPFVVGPDAR